jgi:deazaflavin-dependent oxidoreductase (nitroreductase family)
MEYDGCMSNYIAAGTASGLPAGDAIRRALSRGHRVEITTTGRRSGLPRRIEIVFHNIAGRIFISGLPSRRKRAWIYNLEADPRMTFHLKGPIADADLSATARVITSEPERREVLADVARAWNRTDLDTMVRFSPLIEVLFQPSPAD